MERIKEIEKDMNKADVLWLHLLNLLFSLYPYDYTFLTFSKHLLFLFSNLLTCSKFGFIPPSCHLVPFTVPPETRPPASPYSNISHNF